MDDVTELVGKLSFPNNVRILRCTTESSDGSEDKTYAQLRIRLNGKDWELLATKRYSLQELIGLCCGTSEETVQSQLSIGGFPAVLCSIDSVQTLFWTDAQERRFAFALLSDEVEKEELISTAESLCTALEGEA